MITSYTYKLKPSPSQSCTMDNWLNMLRLLYNYLLKERIEAYEQVKAPVLGDYCRLDNCGECCPLTCSVSKNALFGDPWTTEKKTGNAKKRSAGTQQDLCLPILKQSRPWYKTVNADVLQMLIRRLDTAYKNFFQEGRGYPKPKRRSKFRSFGYKPGQVKFNGNRVRLPGIGWIVFHLSRPLPSGFDIRTATIRKKSDGWYLTVLLEDKSVPDIPTIDVGQVKKAIGVDLGINKLASVSNGEIIENPRFSEKVSRLRVLLQRRASRKKKGSRKRAKVIQRLARLEQKVANRRSDNQWKIANKLVRSADAIIFEDLNIRGMMSRCKPKQDEEGKYLKNGQFAKSGLNRVIADAGWGDLKLKVKAVAEKSGVIFLEVDPKHTSQHCSECGHTSASNRDKEKFLCTECGYLEDADTQASRNILERGLKQLGISQVQLCGVPAKVRPLAVGGSADLSKVAGTPKKLVERRGASVGLPTESGNPQQYIQLSLFEWREVEQSSSRIPHHNL